MTFGRFEDSYADSILDATLSYSGYVVIGVSGTYQFEYTLGPCTADTAGLVFRLYRNRDIIREVAVPVQTFKVGYGKNFVAEGIFNLAEGDLLFARLINKSSSPVSGLSLASAGTQVNKTFTLNKIY